MFFLIKLLINYWSKLEIECTFFEYLVEKHILLPFQNIVTMLLCTVLTMCMHWKTHIDEMCNKTKPHICALWVFCVQYYEQSSFKNLRFDIANTIFRNFKNTQMRPMRAWNKAKSIPISISISLWNNNILQGLDFFLLFSLHECFLVPYCLNKTEYNRT